MALGINTNVASISAQNQLNKSQSLSDQALQRLSSGLRINSAKDDAAGLAISTRMDAQVRGMTVAQRNTNDGISMMQTAEGALSETVNNLQRMRELAVQAANGTNGDNDKLALQAEFDERALEIDRIAKDSSFNGVNLLDAAATISIQVGAGDNAGGTDVIDISLVNMDATALAVNALDISDPTAGDPLAAITAIDTALETVSTQRSAFGASQNRFESVLNTLSASIENVSASNSRILDADFASETAKMSKAQVLQQAGISVLSQANARPQQVLSLLQ